MSVKYGFEAADVIKEGRVTDEEVEAVKKWNREQKHIPLLVDEQIVNFVLSCDGDLEFAKKTVQEFYKARKSSKDLFDDRDVSREDVRAQLEALEYNVFPRRTKDGCAVIFHKLHDELYSKYNMGPAMKLLFMTLDAAIYDHPPTGLVILFDMKGVGLMHLTRIRLNMVSVFCHYLQDGLPVKLKEVHVLNTAYFIDKLMAILKPFLKKELYELLHFHRPETDMETIYKTVLAKECLPENYGGDLPNTTILHQENIAKLADMKSFFDAEEKQRKDDK